MSKQNQSKKHTFVFCGYRWNTQKYGVNRFSEQIIRELDRILTERNIDMDIRLLIPSNAVFEDDFHCIKVEKCGIRYMEKRAKSISSRLYWRYVVFPLYLFRVHGIGIDLTILFTKGNIQFFALHDCLRETYYAEIDKKRKFQRIYLHNARKMVYKPGMHLITVSEFSRQELMRCYHLSRDQIEVIGNGWEHMENIEPDTTILENLGLNKEREYIYILGSREPHKNTAWVLQAAEKNPQYDFVITGMNLRTEGLSTGMLPNLIFTDYIQDNQMKALMLHCKAFLQPSFIEGFGIPPLEALSLGKRIIVSNTSSLPEIFGDSAWYIDPYQPAVDLDELMKTPVGDGKKVLRTYTWRNAAEKMLKLLQTYKE